MGTERPSIQWAARGTTVVMMVGLQGSGKTTTAAKLAKRMVHGGRNPLLVACDLNRPAAVEQLVTLGSQLGLPVHTPGGESDPVKVAEAAVARANADGHSVVILDTAGRLPSNSS